MMESQKARILEICPWDFNRLYRAQRRVSGFLRMRQTTLFEREDWLCPVH